MSLTRFLNETKYETNLKKIEGNFQLEQKRKDDKHDLDCNPSFKIFTHEDENKNKIKSNEENIQNQFIKIEPNGADGIKINLNFSLCLNFTSIKVIFG